MVRKNVPQYEFFSMIQKKVLTNKHRLEQNKLDWIMILSK